MKSGRGAAPVEMILGLLLVAAGLAWWLLARERAPEEVLLASGTVEATQAELGFQHPGQILTVEVSEGDVVQQGQLLATLDAREAEAERDALQAAVEVARARLLEIQRGARPGEVAQADAAVRAGQAAVEERIRDADRARRLHQGGAISTEAMEKAQTALAVAQASLDQAEEALQLLREGPRSEQVAAQQAMVRQAEAGLARVQVVLDRAALTAPFSGVVVHRHREPGEATGPGGPVLSIRDLSDRWVRIFVPGDALGRLALGREVELRGDAFPERSHRGEVVYLGSQAEFTPRNVQTVEERTRLVYPVRIRILEDPQLELKPGLPVDVRLPRPPRSSPDAQGGSAL